MSEIKCPNCGEVFTVDESGYAAIVSQVKDAEFNKELNARLAQIQKENQTKVELAETKVRSEQEKTISELKQEIEKLKGELSINKTNSELAVSKAVQEKDKEIYKLTNDLELKKKEIILNENALKEQHQCPKCNTNFETIQRITGYLVGTTDRWNSGKLAELNDRVVHD